MVIRGVGVKECGNDANGCFVAESRYECFPTHVYEGD